MSGPSVKYHSLLASQFSSWLKLLGGAQCCDVLEAFLICNKIRFAECLGNWCQESSQKRIVFPFLSSQKLCYCMICLLCQEIFQNFDPL